MSTVTAAPLRTNQPPPRTVDLCPASPTGDAAPAPPTPASLARELALRAVDRYERALAYRDRVKAARARAPRAANWADLAWMARTDLDNAEEALAAVIAGAFNLVAPPGREVTPAEEAAAEGFIRRGFQVGPRAYLLQHDLGDLKPGIVLRLVGVVGR